MSQRICSIYDRSPTGWGSITHQQEGSPFVTVQWDIGGKPHPCIRSELIELDDNNRVKPPRVPFRDREERGPRRGRDE